MRTPRRPKTKPPAALQEGIVYLVVQTDLEVGLEDWEVGGRWCETEKEARALVRVQGKKFRYVVRRAAVVTPKGEGT